MGIDAVQRVRLHAMPAEVGVAYMTLHMGTTRVLEDANTTLTVRALAG